jgi:hypothetical protein
MEAQTSLRNAKKEIVSRFIGKHSIHGVGMKQDRLAVYMENDPASLPEPVRKQIGDIASPYKVRIVKEAMPQAK